MDQKTQIKNRIEISADQNWRKNQETDRNGQKQTKIDKKQKGNGKFSNLRFFNKNVNIVSKTQILGAHEAIPCVPE